MPVTLGAVAGRVARRGGSWGAARLERARGRASAAPFESAVEKSVTQHPGVAAKTLRPERRQAITAGAPGALLTPAAEAAPQARVVRTTRRERKEAPPP